jgi:xanthosine utilization system XapX-like protein
MANVLLALLAGLVVYIIYSYLTRRKLPNDPRVPLIAFDWPIVRHAPFVISNRHLKLDIFMELMKKHNSDNLGM